MLKKIADLTDKLARLQNTNGLLVEACEKVMADSIADCAVGLLVTAQTLVGVSDALDAAKEAGR